MNLLIILLAIVLLVITFVKFILDLNFDNFIYIDEIDITDDIATSLFQRNY